VVWIEAVYTPVLDGDGKPERVLKVATDVTAEKARTADFEGQLAAIGKAQAVIEFELDGTIRTANDNFLQTLGYTLDEVRGKHHNLFVTPAHAASAEYRAFWDKLGRGEFDRGQYKRIGKGGREVWIEASYNPILDAAGRPVKVVKFATDITADRVRNADFAGQIAAIGKSQAVIEFELDGTIRTANDNFLQTLGYTLDEIRGRHHSLFVEPGYAASTEYHEFWARLGRGQFDRAQYKRVAKGGRVVWIEASYNPIMDPDGRPVKVVKFATDVTAQRERADALKTLVEEITRSSQTITTSAEEIVRGNEDLSQRTQEQAASLEETAASMNEMAATVRGNAANAVDADRLAQTAAGQAERGGAVVSDAVGAMRGINASSRRIQDIIGVIDEIAFQINLLALNAAVEAARAGEQGRGFAVVATEVRNLAGRSAAAAREIKDLINDSVGKVAEGSRLVEDSGATLGQIVTSVRSLAQLVAGIASASTQQSAAIEQVNQAVGQMDSVTQQNSALVEQASAASESILEQARRLRAALVAAGQDASPVEAAGHGADQGKAERRGTSRPWAGGSAQARRA
jgi:methyl-accepting chemotaxis protein